MKVRFQADADFNEIIVTALIRLAMTRIVFRSWRPNSPTQETKPHVPSTALAASAAGLPLDPASEWALPTVADCCSAAAALRGLDRRNMPRLPGLRPSATGPGKPHAEADQESLRAGPQSAGGPQVVHQQGQGRRDRVAVFLQGQRHLLLRQIQPHAKMIQHELRGLMHEVELDVVAGPLRLVEHPLDHRRHDLQRELDDLRTVHHQGAGPALALAGLQGVGGGPAPPSATISVSAPRPSVPKTNPPSDGSPAASISVAAAPSPKIVRKERSVGWMYFE